MKYSTSTCRKFDSQELLLVTISVSHDDDESWFDAHIEFFDLWYNTSETMDNYDKWDEPPDICSGVGINNESTNKHIETDFHIGECKT